MSQSSAKQFDDNKSPIHFLKTEDQLLASDIGKAIIDFVQLKITKDIARFKLNLSAMQKLSMLNSMCNAEFIYARFFAQCALKLHERATELLKLKLVVCNFHAYNLIPSFCRYFHTPVQPKCRFIHTALQVGPWMIHWFDNGCVVIDQYCDNVATVTIDLGTAIIPANDKADIIKLIYTIIKWNTTKTYHCTRSNCQMFIEDVLESINRNNMKNVPNAKIIEDFFNVQRNYVFKIGFFKRVFKNRFQNDAVEEFNTHEQLDNYVRKFLAQYIDYNNNKLATNDPSDTCRVPLRKFLKFDAFDCKGELSEALYELMIDFPADYALLHCFDRAYWMQIFKESKKARDEKRRPVHNLNDLTENCPFNDPTITSRMPFMKQWIQDCGDCIEDNEQVKVLNISRQGKLCNVTVITIK